MLFIVPQIILINYDKYKHANFASAHNLYYSNLCDS